MDLRKAESYYLEPPRHSERQEILDLREENDFLRQYLQKLIDRYDEFKRAVASGEITKEDLMPTKGNRGEEIQKD